ncbi:hypothetical protein [Paenibacillus qinlingensis]|uniref:Uncharacterized protein n=1 Tax=Paenibacillus qinlingensis TaxID=1837343 RepID=A0ABU1P3A5_9BACL|nr:hypothetical protein [Paenibacillus qinlingensis]MDR6553836.1 hypothetical protein [Paenibacillus qinlingensis]
MKRSISHLGVYASLGSMLLCCWFLFWNPYSEVVASRDTMLLLLVMLIAPAGVGLIGSFLKNRKLLIVAFIWSLPYGLYLALASLPSFWYLFGVTLLLYLAAALRMRPRP